MSEARRFVRRKAQLLPRIGEVFAGTLSSSSSNHTLGEWFSGDQDDPPGDSGIQGILTEDSTPIFTEGGQWIQAENQ